MGKSRKLLRLLLLVIIPVTVVVVGGHFWVKSTRYVSTENAYVKAHHLAISADIDGRTLRVLAKENDVVKRGDLLFQLDPEPHQIDLATAEAEIAGIRNTIAALRAEYREAKAELTDGMNRLRKMRLVNLNQQIAEHAKSKELSAAVDEVIAEVGASAAGELGKVMGPLMERVRGRADGRHVTALVRERLAGD